MDSDSSGCGTTSYSVDEEIARHLQRLKEKRTRNKENVQNKRKLMFENFTTHNYDQSPFNLEGMHFYSFDHSKVKFGFNPSEVAHVTKKIKFVCILRYTGRFWTLGRNTIPANWKPRIYEIFFKRKSVSDRSLVEAINAMHSIFMKWSEHHAEFRRNKISKYRSGEIEFFDLDSEDEELYLDQVEKTELEHKRERILKRMIPPKMSNQRKREIPHERRIAKFPYSPNIHLDSD